MLDIFQAFFLKLYDLLPESPFQGFLTTLEPKYLAYLNWFIPFDIFLQMTSDWLACILAYYLFRMVYKIVVDFIIGKILA